MVNCFWVVEIFEKGQWKPSVSVGLTRKDARRERDFYWTFNFPKVKTRVRKYVAEGTPKKKRKGRVISEFPFDKCVGKW